MKKRTLFLLLLSGTCFLTAMAQPGIQQIYAWKQAGALPGIRHTQVTEQNEILQSKKMTRETLRLFLDMQVTAPVLTDLIWVEGKAYKTIEERPGRGLLLFKTAGLGTSYKTDTLAPATRAFRKEIRVGQPVKQLVRTARHIPETGVWLRYWWKGKQYIQEIKNFRELPESVLE